MIPIVRKGKYQHLEHAEWFAGDLDTHPFPIMIVDSWESLTESYIEEFEAKWTERIQRKGTQDLSWDVMFAEYWYRRIQSHRGELR